MKYFIIIQILCEISSLGEHHLSNNSGFETLFMDLNDLFYYDKDDDDDDDDIFENELVKEII